SLGGGGALRALAMPAAVGLLRATRGRAAVLLVAVTALCVLGLSLTYTRTFLGAVAGGVVVTLAVPLAKQAGRRSRTIVKLLGVTALLAFALTFTFGASDLSAGEAVLLRLTGG